MPCVRFPEMYTYFKSSIVYFKKEKSHYTISTYKIFICQSYFNNAGGRKECTVHTLIFAAYFLPKFHVHRTLMNSDKELYRKHV